jgi:hypothetical protein
VEEEEYLNSYCGKQFLSLHIRGLADHRTHLRAERRD